MNRTLTVIILSFLTTLCHAQQKLCLKMNNDTTAYNKTALLVLYTTTDTIKSYYTNLIGSLNPDDVNVVKILKGNNAAELFGAEAKNGALLMYMKQTFKSDSSKIDLDRLLKNFNPNLPVYLDSCYIKYPNAF